MLLQLKLKAPVFSVVDMMGLLFILLLSLGSVLIPILIWIRPNHHQNYPDMLLCFNY
jgi:hypothetical protein